MITLLLVDDDPLLREGLRMWLERTAGISVIGEADNGARGVALAQEIQPDVVLMDISLPADGIAATTALRTLVPRCSVVFLSLHDDAALRAGALRAGALRAGAASLVGKQEGIRALLDAIYEAGGQGRALPKERYP